MDERQDRNTMRRRGLSRTVLRLYLLFSAVLAVLRVTLLICNVHRFESDAVNEAFRRLQWGLFPEALLITRTSLGVRDTTPAEIVLGGGAVLAAGSVVLSLPIVLAGWAIWRRRKAD